MHCACSTFEECSNSKKYAETFTFAQRILDVHDNRVWIQMIIVYEYSQRKLSERSSVQKYHEIASCVCRRSTCAQCCNSKYYVENFTFAIRIRDIHDHRVRIKPEKAFCTKLCPKIPRNFIAHFWIFVMCSMLQLEVLRWKLHVCVTDSWHPWPQSMNSHRNLSVGGLV